MTHLAFQAQSVITKVSTMVDGGIRITVDTGELSPETTASLFNLKGASGWLLFAPNPLQETDIPKEPAKSPSGSSKTPSARQRAVLYIAWQQSNMEEPFDLYYIREMEKIIETIKQKLN